MKGLKFHIFPALAMALTACAPSFVTYEQYGAVGDGVHDDQDAIVAAHNAANEKNLPVRAKDGATYYIGKGAEVAVIKTDVDWGSARFIIDDVVTDDYTRPIFKVQSCLEPYAVEGVAPLKRGQANLGVKLPQRSLVEVTNNLKRVYIRRGLNQNGGVAQKEMLIVGKDGTIFDGAPVIWDYDTLALESTAALENRLSLEGFQAPVKAWPIDDKQLTVKGGVFITVANQAESQYKYRSRNIVVNRSNVLLEGLSHYVVGEVGHGAPYSGFITLNHAAEVTVSNCLLTPHKMYYTIGSAGLRVPMGSYDVEAEFCISLLFKGLRQTINIDDSQYWGLYASNFCKDLNLEDCIISRFDAHMGVCNVHLKDCIFGHMGVQMVGFGTALFENCEMHRNRMIWLRDDYGSSWDGDIIIRNCRQVIPVCATSSVFHGSNDGHHDFGYDCRLPHMIDIDGLEIDDSAAPEGYQGPYLFSSFDRDITEEGLIPFPADCKVKLANITVTSGRPLLISPEGTIFDGMVE